MSQKNPKLASSKGNVKRPKTAKKEKVTVVLRDNIFGITKPALKRLLRRAGVKRISSSVYEKMRTLLKTHLETLVKDAVIFADNKKRKTLYVEDLEAALNINGIALAAGLNKNATKTKTLQSCSSRHVSDPISKASEPGTKKKHRFRPGTVALRAIRYHQSHSDCLAIPKANFERLIREVAQEFKDGVRFAKGFFDLTQLICENYLVEISKASNLLAIHAARETISVKDFDLVLQIRKG
jgi:histone H3